MAPSGSNLKSLGDVLAAFDAEIRRLQDALAGDPALYEAIFGAAAPWLNLLRNKLKPHLEGEGCLVVAVAGGTNTGKSTVFNLLIGEVVSPVKATAAATCRPLLTGSPSRIAECLDGRLVPEFKAMHLDDPEAVVSHDSRPDAMYVRETDNLPGNMIVLDTPDVDSIDKANWQVADAIGAAGDVIVAVLTGEKYKDDRVVAFFRRAHASGRILIPLMNKADPENGFNTARKQLDEFLTDIGIDAPCFVLPHAFDLPKDPQRPIESIDGGEDLRVHLRSLDIPSIKERVYRGSVTRFGEQAAEFLEGLDDVAQILRRAREEFDLRAADYARQYDPMPGARVGGLFHEFVQSKRGPVRRWIGSTGKAVAKGAGAVGRSVRNALLRRASLEAEAAAPNEEELRAAHAQAVDRIAREFLASIIESSENLREPAGHLVRTHIGEIRIERSLDEIRRQVLQTENVSEAFHEHAFRTLDTWWNDHKGTRRVLESLDAVLAIAPTAIAVPLAMHTGGIGVAESVAVAGPLAEQFLARVIEYQFGDALFDFLSPWKKEQQEALRQALQTHVVNPALASLQAYLNILDGESVANLRKWQEQCLET